MSLFFVFILINNFLEGNFKNKFSELKHLSN